MALLREGAQTFYLAKKQLNNDKALTWEEFRTALLNEYESPTRIDELHSQLVTICFHNNVSQYITQVQKLEMQITPSEMTVGDRLFYFVCPLPVDLAVHVRKTQPKTMVAGYESA